MLAILRHILTALLIVIGVSAANALEMPNETLRYKVTYKWGLIQKQAGTATLKLKKNGNTYTATLYASSEPWADRFYRLRDTLRSTMSHDDMLPLRYEKIAHEDGRYARDILEIRQLNGSVTAECVRQRRSKGKSEIVATDTVLYANGPTVDMLSVFYYLRTLDIKAMRAGETVTVNILSGKRVEYLKIKYKGIEDIKVEDKRYNTFRLEFVFTSDGHRQSSDPMDVWVTADTRHIPVKLEGNLPVGKIRCLYIGDN